MAIVLALALSIFWGPAIYAGMYGMAAVMLVIPSILFLSTARGANALHVDEFGMSVRIVRHYLLWSKQLWEGRISDLGPAEATERSVEVEVESPLNALAGLLAPLGVHVHFRGTVEQRPAWDLVLTTKSGDRLVVLTTWDRASADAAQRHISAKSSPTP